MRLITIAIHTLPYARQLKQILEEQNIETMLQNVNLENPSVSPGVRVRIHEHDLTRALTIVEREYRIRGESVNSFNAGDALLVPTDLSTHSLNACALAMNIAQTLHTGIRLLHAFITPSVLAAPSLIEELNFDNDDNLEMDATLDRQAEQKMKSFVDKISAWKKDGTLPDVKIETIVTEGLPEETVVEEVRLNNPPLIVMGTRAAAKKEREVIGSVTAEVLDTVRCPVLSVPEDSALRSPSDIKRILFFVAPDQQDILAVDTMQRLLQLNKSVDVIFMNIPSRRKSANDTDLDSLLTYCESHYPILNFTTRHVTADTLAAEISAFNTDSGIDLITIANRRRNMFARLFNPSLAHRLLFRADIPMLSIPV